MQHYSNNQNNLVNSSNNQNNLANSSTQNSKNIVVNRSLTSSLTSSYSKSRTRRSLAETVKNEEDYDGCPPPNIAPISGVPNYSNKTELVRPIAFRPVPVPGDRPMGISGDRQLSLDRPLEHDHSTYSSVYIDQGVLNQRRPADGFAPGHLLVREGSRHYGSSQDLNRPAPPASYNKFSSLDRRALVRRHQANQPHANPAIQPNQTICNQPNQIKLSTFSPPDSKVKSCQPERRHSSYNPSSSLHRTPSQNSEYRLKRGKVLDGVNSMNVNGLPEPFRSFTNQTPDKFRPLSVRSTESRNRNSGAGTPQFQALTAQQLNRNNQGSLTNLNNQYAQYQTISRLKNNRSELETGYEGSDEDYQTPSPSDSAVGDLESMLKVYEEKERMWEREVKKIKSLYETRLKANQQKASKMEAALLNQIYQLQNEKCKLETDSRDLNERRERELKENQLLKADVQNLREEMKRSEKMLEERQIQDKQVELRRESVVQEAWEEEVSSYKSEILDLQRTISDLRTEKTSLLTEMNQLKSLLEMAGEDFSLEDISTQKEIIIERDREIEVLRQELEDDADRYDQLKTELDNQREHFEQETANWLTEKEKVIRYQKQLQLNYVSMYKRNKGLENELEQLRRAAVEQQQQKHAGHVSSAKAKLFSKFSSKFGDSSA